MGLAHNVISDYYRVKRNKQEIATDFEATPSMMGLASKDSYEEIEERLVLESLFARLNERYAPDTALGKLVCAIQEMIDEGIACNDYAEITRRTGIPDHNVRVYFHRMAKAARELLEDDHRDE